MQSNQAKQNYFSELASIDVNAQVEKKGSYAYLSWAWAVDRLRRFDSLATWSVKRFEGLPYLQTPCGFFVEVEVTVKGITLSQLLPILNAQNKPIEVPSNFNINASIQRCLVKAIALHGLGLYLYAGEELPTAIETAANETTTSINETATPIIKVAQPSMDALLGEQLRQCARQGTASLKAAWEKLTVEQRQQMASSLVHWKQTASYVDKKGSLSECEGMSSEASESFKV